VAPRPPPPAWRRSRCAVRRQHFEIVEYGFTGVRGERSARLAKRRVTFGLPRGQLCPRQCRLRLCRQFGVFANPCDFRGRLARGRRGGRADDDARARLPRPTLGACVASAALRPVRPRVTATLLRLVVSRAPPSGARAAAPPTLAAVQRQAVGAFDDATTPARRIARRRSPLTLAALERWSAGRRHACCGGPFFPGGEAGPGVRPPSLAAEHGLCG
jgi:hypothetical protein